MRIFARRIADGWWGGWVGWLVVAVALTLGSDLAQAQGAATPEPLTLEGIARDTEEWVGSAPSQIRWSQDGESLYFMWNPEAADIPDLYVVSCAGGTPQKVPSDELRNVPPRGAMRRTGTRPRRSTPPMATSFSSRSPTAPCAG